MSTPEPPEELDRQDLTSLPDADSLVDDFENALRMNGVAIVPGSQLERICLSVHECCRINQGQSSGDPGQDVRAELREVLGLIDIAKRVVRLRRRPHFTGLVDHLRLLNQCSVVQNVSCPADRVSDKIFELLIGLICLEAGQDVALDHPLRSLGDNPDVLVTLAGRRWGLACKVPGGPSALTMFERIEDGIRQIERSPAEIGCVVLNLKNVIDHDALWPIVNPVEAAAGEPPMFGAWGDISRPVELLKGMARQRQEALVVENTFEQIERLFRGRKAVPGALALLQTGTGVQTSRGPMPTLLGMFVFMDLLGMGGEHANVLSNLNDALHHR